MLDENLGNTRPIRRTGGLSHDGVGGHYRITGHVSVSCNCLIAVVAALAVTAVAQSVGAQVNPPREMCAWWPFEEATGTPVHDLASVDNVGTPIGSPTSISGKVGQALSFNGASDYVEVPDDPELDFGTGSLTIDAWVQTNASGIQPIVTKRTGGLYPAGYMLFLFNGRLGFQMADGFVGAGTCNCSTPGAACDNYVSAGPDIRGTGWCHVAVSVDRSAGSVKTGALYVDGILCHTFIPRALSVSNTADLWIGRRQATNCESASYFTGDIDELETFCRALTQDEIRSIVDAQSLGKRECLPWAGDMVDWWTFDRVFSQRYDDIEGAFRNVGTHQNATAAVVPSIVGGALSLSGTDFVSVTDQAEVDFGTGSFTIDAWVRTSASGIRPIVDKRTGGLLPVGYTLFLVNGVLGFQMADANGTNCVCNTPAGNCDNYVSSGPDIRNTGWRHVAVTVDRTIPPGHGILYVDCNMVHTFTPRSGNLDNTADLWIGRHHTNDCATTDRYWVGEIDELEMFDWALGPVWITALCEADSLGKCKPCCCCPSQEDFDEDGFTTVIDLGVIVDIVFHNAPDVQDYNCPVPRGDSDLDGFTTVLDVTHKIDEIFHNGSPPPDPCEPQW